MVRYIGVCDASAMIATALQFYFIYYYYFFNENGTNRKITRKGVIILVVYPNWPLLQGSPIKNWEKLDPLFCV